MKNYIKINMIIKYFLAFLLTFGLAQSFATDYKTMAESYQINFDLSVNATSNPAVRLIVKSPKNYYTLPNLLEDFMGKGQIKSIEFIPKGETFQNWTEILTVHHFLGMGLSSRHMVNDFLRILDTKTIRFNVLINEHIKTDSYEMSKLAVVYEESPGKTEFLTFEYYNGPYDCAGLQYTIVLDSWPTDQEKELLLNDSKTDGLRAFSQLIF